MPEPAILLLLSLTIAASITITGPAARGVGVGLAPAQAYRPAGDNAHMTPLSSVDADAQRHSPSECWAERSSARSVTPERWAAAGSEIGVIPWWWPGPCNRPASDMPPAPDGCPDYAPVAPPQAPIPPACVSDARVEEWQEACLEPCRRDGQPVTDLFITVDHPELCGPYDCPGSTRVCSGTIHLARYGNGPWTWVDINADVSCAKDEGPLTWATLEILNHTPGDAGEAGRLDALAIYTAPLPSPYLDLLAQLGGWQWHRVYLPIIKERDP